MKKTGKILLLVLIGLVILMAAGYLFLYHNGYSGKMLKVDAWYS